MKTFVKITGLADANHLSLLPEGGAAGFVIGIEGAPGVVTIEEAATHVEKVPAEVEVWATVVDPSADLVHRLFDEVGVDRVQVYGAVPAELEFLEIHHLIPSLPIPLDGTVGPEPKIPPAEDFSRLHLDAIDRPWMDGSARKGDWEMCARIVDSQPGRKLVLAGGLTAENVGDALAMVRPWGIDVSAGVRGADGAIDPERLKAFIAAVATFESTNST